MRRLPTVEEAVIEAASHPDGLASLIGRRVTVSTTGRREVPTDGFLQYMRDQGAQRAYRNVLEWLNHETILDTLGKINSELLVIDARRTAFRNQPPRKEEPCPKREHRDRDLKEMLKAAAEQRKGKRSSSAGGRKERKKQQPRRRRTR